MGSTVHCLFGKLKSHVLFLADVKPPYTSETLQGC